MENKKIKLIIFDYDDTIIERNSELIFSDLKEAEQIIEYINNWIQKGGYNDEIRMLLQVHDELLFEVKENLA